MSLNNTFSLTFHGFGLDLLTSISSNTSKLPRKGGIYSGGSLTSLTTERRWSGEETGGGVIPWIITMKEIIFKFTTTWREFYFDTCLMGK